jgi:hypothetical protein
MPLPNPIFIVITYSRNGAVLQERKRFEDLSRSEVVKDIAFGQFEIGAVTQVIEVDLSAGTARDVSKDIASEVMTIWARRGEPLSDDEYEFVDAFVSTQAANSFRRAA